jgi:DNA-binding transcriptional LysR family regulator
LALLVMELGDLRYLLASADAGNFSRAAGALGRNASTLSRRIGRLESELGLPLFERRHGGIKLTSCGRAILAHVRRALAEIDAIREASFLNAVAEVGQVRLGVRMPPVGEPLSSLLARWREHHPRVNLKIAELADRDIAIALEERRLDVALIPSFTLWPHAAALQIYRERIVVALPTGHGLTTRPCLGWEALREETILVQGWDESQTQREYFASLLGSGVNFQTHAASKQSVLALVEAGFGITLAAESQSEVSFPGVVFRPIAEPNAWFRVDLAWMPEAEEPAIGRFVAFMRDESKSLCLL